MDHVIDLCGSDEEESVPGLVNRFVQVNGAS